MVSKLRHGRWLQVYRGVYATFTGPIGRDAELWAVVLYTGSGARLSHETAAELIHLRDRPSPLIHVTIAAKRRVVAPAGVAIHRSVSLETSWRFARGIPPHTFAEETVIDLVHAAANLDDVIGYVTGSFARNLTSEERLRREAAGRKRSAGGPTSTRSSRRRRVARTRSSSTATTGTWSKPTVSRVP